MVRTTVLGPTVGDDAAVAGLESAGAGAGGVCAGRRAANASRVIESLIKLMVTRASERIFAATDRLDERNDGLVTRFLS